MAHVWYVSPQGTKQGDGTTSAPWSLRHALIGAPVNKQPRIKPGDTVLLRHGIYPYDRENNVDRENKVTVSGTAAAPVTFCAYPGEIPLIDGAMPEFQAASEAWERETLSSELNLYRSVRTLENTPKTARYAGLIVLDGGFYTLAVHRDLKSLRSTHHLFREGPYYVGPGLAWDRETQRIYLRLDNSTAEAQRNRRNVTQIADPDPRKHSIHIGRSDRYGFLIEASHLRFVGLHFRAQAVCWVIKPPQTDLQFIDCAGEPLGRVARFNRATNVKVLGGTYDGHMHSENWWVSVIDMHRKDAVAGAVEKVAFDLGASSNVELGPSPSGERMIVRQFFDGILAEGPLHDVEVHGIWFDEMWDDSWQQRANIHNVDYHDNVHFGAGPSRSGEGTGTPDGTVYIHDNVIDTTVHQIFYRRSGADAEQGIGEAIPFSSHKVPPPGKPAIPWKLYHNTVFTGVNALPKPVGIGPVGSSQERGQPPHEVYNNIFVVLDGRPLGIRFWAESGLEVYDGNCVWSGGHWLKRGALYRLVHTSTEPAGKAVKSIQEMQASQAHRDSWLYYRPGWDNSSIEVDPALDESYMSTATAARTGAVTIPSGWPGSGHRQRGAQLTTPLPGGWPSRGSNRQ